ncbi:HalOD1 output domain-containing protein [Natrinema salaciae]|nr:HalOD1 output domain-containing protein [Natrinema salaciae]
MTVIDLVARTDDTEPIELEPLYDAIDPDLLDSLPDADGFTELEFSYEGYAVTVADADDGVEVTLESAAISADGSTSEFVDTGSSI